MRNPVLQLPAMQRLHGLPPESRNALVALVSDIRNEARERASQSLSRRKRWSYAYWSVVAVYAGHLARAMRRAPEAA